MTIPQNLPNPDAEEIERIFKISRYDEGQAIHDYTNEFGSTSGHGIAVHDYHIAAIQDLIRQSNEKLLERLHTFADQPKALSRKDIHEFAHNELAKLRKENV